MRKGCWSPVPPAGAKPSRFTQADLTRPLFVLIGGERRGITRSLLRQADLILQVPYRREFKPALGASSSAAVVAFEVFRQRRYGQP